MSMPPANLGRRRRDRSGTTCSTVVSAAILIGAEVFGAAFAGGWAIANLFDLGPIRRHIAHGAVFFLCGIAVMVAFMRARAARRAVHDAR